MAEVRQLWTNTRTSANTYALVGNAFYVGAATLLGNVTNTSGVAYITDNNDQVAVCDPGQGLWMLDVSGSIWSQVTTFTEGGAFITPRGLCYLDTYFIITEDDSEKFYISDQLDGDTWSSTDFASAETIPDKLITCLSSNRQLWLFGEFSTEVWVNRGDASFPFVKVPGANIEWGTNAEGSVAILADAPVWLSSKNQVVRADGYRPIVISTPQIDYQIGTYSTVSDARAFTYTANGHEFYCISFPTADKTWCFDIATGFWHERSSSGGRWKANCHTFVSNKNIVGDASNNKTYELDDDTFTDDGTAITRTRRAQYVQVGRQILFHNELEVLFETGVGATYSVTLKWSDDNGNTWSSGIAIDLGGTTNYADRAVWRKLGKSRKRIYEITTSSAVAVNIISAHLKLKPGRY